MKASSRKADGILPPVQGLPGTRLRSTLNGPEEKSTSRKLAILEKKTGVTRGWKRAEEL